MISGRRSDGGEALERLCSCGTAREADKEKGAAAERKE
jgi:hypothetical protein